jgi:hypothetical protein
MRCSHHLIQEHPATQPDIPALTPEGFQEWMTAMIQAYPDIEYERMSKTVLDMPISNADDPRERFPKELPRRLFPRKENIQAQQRCAANLSAEGVGPLRRAPTFPPPPPMSQGSTPAPNFERERSPYGSKSDSVDLGAEEELTSCSVPIERQRKPYVAMPHGGKIYDDSSQTTHADAPPNHQRKRAQSSAAQSPWAATPSEEQYSQHMLVGLAAPAFPATGHTLIQTFGIFPAVIMRPTCMGHNRNLDDTAKKKTRKDMTAIEEVPSQQTALMIISHDQCTTVTTTKVVQAAAVTMTEATILVDTEAAH